MPHNARNYLVIEEPDLEEVAIKMNELRKTHVMVLYLSCEVDYRGRAASKLSLGDRLLMTKPDGTLIIHERVKREPVNWQPPGSLLYCTVKADELIIRSIRRSPWEEIIVRSPHVYVFLAALSGKGVFRLWGSEDEMVQEVFRKPRLIEEGFKPLKKEVRTPYGTIDLLGEDSKGNLVVLEFKRSTAQLSGVSQLKRYVDYMSHRYENVRGILVAPDITSSALRLLKEYGFEYRKLRPPRPGPKEK